VLPVALYASAALALGVVLIVRAVRKRERSLAVTSRR